MYIVLLKLTPACNTRSRIPLYIDNTKSLHKLKIENWCLKENGLNHEADDNLIEVF